MYDYEANRDKLHSSTGHKLTTSLFEELTREDVAAKPVFKLSEWRKVYVDVADPTDYAAALELIGSWDRWLALIESPAFAKEVDKSRLEVEAKLRSEGMKQLMKQARLPTGTAAAKWLAEAGFIERDKRKKKDKQDDEKTLKEAKTKVSEDAKRLGLSLVK